MAKESLAFARQMETEAVTTLAFADVQVRNFPDLPHNLTAARWSVVVREARTDDAFKRERGYGA